MARFEEQHWSANLGAPTSRARKPGRISVYLPDPISEMPLIIGAQVQHRVAQVEEAIRNLAHRADLRGIDVLTRFLARREAIASSAIEGLQVAPRQLAIAEVQAAVDALTSPGTLPPWKESTADTVLANIRAVNDGVDHLVSKSMWSVDDLVYVQGLLVPEEMRGVRTSQNWIGGSSWTPIDAEFIPPPADMLPELLRDLMEYASGALHSPLIQAAIVHAQFETLHPFGDGNGRTGRALIHAVLKRRALAPGVVLPISAAMGARSREYVDGLTAFRFVGRQGSEEHSRAVEAWLGVFLDATEAAVAIVTDLAEQVAVLEEAWHQKYVDYHALKGKTRQPRRDSAAMRIYREVLLSRPALTAKMVANDLTGVSSDTARRSLRELEEAGILRAHKDRGKVLAYYSPELFELLTFGELNLASSQYDAEKSPPPRGSAPQA